MDRSDQLLRDQVRMLGQVLGETVAELSGPPALEQVEGTRRAAVAMRAGQLPGGREAFHGEIAALPLEGLELLAGAFTDFFHLINAAEEQSRIRALRARDVPGRAPDGSVARACQDLAAGGTAPEAIQRLLDRLLVMPVLTAHPTEARRRTVLDHVERISGVLERLDDPRAGTRERERLEAELRAGVVALVATQKSRSARPTPLDEVKSSLLVFERTLLDVTPALVRELEHGLEAAFPGAALRVPSFLRWGTWVGGDRDGNPFVTAEVTRATLERQRALALGRYVRDAWTLERELAARAQGAGLAELSESLERDRAALPGVAGTARVLLAPEPWREKLRYVAARLQAARDRAEGAYPDAQAYLDDLALVARTLEASGLGRLARGTLRDARRRAEAFGFHLATLDVRQHSGVHERAAAELLAQGGIGGYAAMAPRERIRLLAGLLGRAGLSFAPDRARLSPETREALATLEVVGRARRDIGPAACERYIVSFTRDASDLLEVLLLARAARLAPDELRVVPLLEQHEDLERAGEIAEDVLELEPLRAACAGDLEVMIGYSDSGKQMGYVASQVALHRAQLALAEVAEGRGTLLTVFHGRGGAVGRGGGPAHRAIRAQPPQALRGRFRVTEQGETVAARYGRLEIARRDLEQMTSAVLVASLAEAPRAADEAVAEREATLARGARAAYEAYRALVSPPDRLAAYAVAATPIQEVMSLRIASRPASRSRRLAFEDLRAISWVFSWNQSRHGIPGWFGLGSCLEAIAREQGPARLRALYDGWPFFRGIVDNARLALTQADMEVAAHYARLAPPEAAGVFEVIRAEHARTVEAIRALSGGGGLLDPWPALGRTAERRNPYIDVLSHVQVTLLDRLRRAPPAEQERIREVLLLAVNGIAAGLQTVG
jgi:phosphoenolpyruvate carboxylase